MKNILIKSVLIAMLGASIVGCSNMDRQQKNTAVGAAIGGAAGAIIGDSTGATLGGAALGGLIGSQVR
ncbi:osmotically inducible lipoprotein OsmB [Cricetibacter osteomyelitidis]|uniref:Osmotically inducible lipoprotein OsmB n=2 Tax=Cricetibacter osteomyelitidis TaxID=1521931 RepID=A0A4V2T1E7_9PAST|nr:glycine zipper 2TM domain-containing protein [Cricetibacter osteomyelitidis]TCP93323.1 osmotically inducible lipoprotein OsmB [Cricetibacter osteomyelitidis]